MERKFYPLDRFPGYMINTSGEVQDPEGNLLRPFMECNALYYEIGGRGYSAAKLVWETFVGELNTYIRYSDNDIFNISISNLYVELDIQQISTTEFRINDITYKVIPGFSSYVISKRGTIYSLKRRQFIIRTFNHAGYPTVPLVDDSGFRSPRKVHRMVYLTYIGRLDSNMVIDHIDVNNLNPEVWNLRQISQRENVYRTFNGKEYRPFNYIEPDIKEISNYSDEDIITICRMLAENKPHNEILSKLERNDTNQEYNSLVSLTSKLRARESNADIADKYNVPIKGSFPGKGRRPGQFSQSDIKFIIDEFNRGRPQQSLANVYNCSQALISHIITDYSNNLIDVEGSTTIEKVS